ncbi:FkbM family methyltransferase [Methanolobus sp.]|uniref:FkbM family methyltransferase n=1 Tax=Methanolobus sp. TaxID=1874737 RepID=UPI002600BDD8|nr:FkbM family methyltransferase [Methanolobus sp.]
MFINENATRTSTMVGRKRQQKTWKCWQMRLITRLIQIYLAKPYFYKINRFLFLHSLNGIGIFNYENNKVSGEQWLIRKLAKIGSLSMVIDVGSNEGSYIDLLLENNPTSVIFAIEAHPITYKRLEAKYSDSRNVTTLNMAVSDEKGIVDIFDYGNCEGGSQHASLYKDVIVDIHCSKQEPKKYSVQMLTLDEIMFSANIGAVKEVDLLKIDTEGHEKAVLLGALKTIKKYNVKYIHFEFNEMNVVSKTTFYEFTKILEGYRLFRLLPCGLIPLDPYVPILCELYGYQNILAIKKGETILK